MVDSAGGSSAQPGVVRTCDIERLNPRREYLLEPRMLRFGPEPLRKAFERRLDICRARRRGTHSQATDATVPVGVAGLREPLE